MRIRYTLFRYYRYYFSHNNRYNSEIIVTEFADAGAKTFFQKN
jgi:hypothetical protein